MLREEVVVVVQMLCFFFSFCLSSFGFLFRSFSRCFSLSARSSVCPKESRKLHFGESSRTEGLDGFLALSHSSIFFIARSQGLCRVLNVDEERSCPRGIIYERLTSASTLECEQKTFVAKRNFPSLIFREALWGEYRIQRENQQTSGARVLVPKHKKRERIAAHTAREKLRSCRNTKLVWFEKSMDGKFWGKTFFSSRRCGDGTKQHTERNC
jgi:hypothetical protein